MTQQTRLSFSWFPPVRPMARKRIGLTRRNPASPIDACLKL